MTCGPRTLDRSGGGTRSHTGRQALQPARTGFSLIELLATIAIILILTTLYWGPNNASRHRALKSGCRKNLERLYVSLGIFANDHNGQFPQVAGAPNSEAALDVLIPKYTSDTSAFICPGSKDPELPSGASIAGRKISYAYYMGRVLTNISQVLLTDWQVDTAAKAPGQLVFSSTGKPPGNNHRRFGGNLLFCDGRVQSSASTASIPLPIGAGETLLNP